MMPAATAPPRASAGCGVPMAGIVSVAAAARAVSVLVTAAGPGADFVELYNPSATEAVDLSGWALPPASP